MKKGIEGAANLLFDEYDFHSINDTEVNAIMRQINIDNTILFLRTSDESQLNDMIFDNTLIFMNGTDNLTSFLTSNQTTHNITMWDT